MSIETEIYGHLQLNLPNYFVFYGKVNTTSGDKTISFFRLPGVVVQDNPIKEVVYQVSCRAREIDDCRTMASEVINLFRGLYGKLTNINIRVIEIQDLGDLYEEESNLVHIPLQIITQVVE